MYREKKIPIPVAERSKSRVYGRSLAGIAGSNPVGSVCVSLFYCVLSGYGPSEGPIPRCCPEVAKILDCSKGNSSPGHAQGGL